MKRFRDKKVKVINATLMDKKTKRVVLCVSVDQLKKPIEEIKKEYLVKLEHSTWIYTAKRQEHDWDLDNLTEEEFNKKYDIKPSEFDGILGGM